MSSQNVLTLATVLEKEQIPGGRLVPTGDLDEVLQSILITDYSGPRIAAIDPGYEVELSTASEQVFELPGLGGMELVIGGPEAAPLTVSVEGDVDKNTLSVGVMGGIRLRFPREWLKPMQSDGDGWTEHPSREHAEIDLSAGISINQDGDVSVKKEAETEFSIAPAMIADTGFVVEGTVALDFSKTETIDASENLSLPGGQSISEDWQGVVFTDTTLHFPEAMNVPVENIGLENFHIGTGGITGTVSLEGDMPQPDSANAKKLFGIPYQITTLDVRFVQTALASSSIEAKMQLPFFDDTVELDLGVTMAGDVTATLSSTEDSLQTVKREYFRLKLERLGFAYEEDVPAVSIGGTVEPRNDNIPAAATIPSVDVEELRIDAEGNVAVEGGWLDLGDQYVAEVGPAELEVTRFGIGKTDAGGKWIGFNGGVKFMAGVPAGASVEGLRITWDEPGTSGASVSLDGIGVELEVPGSFAFKGEVSWADDAFRGAIDLELENLDVRVDAELVIGIDQYPYLGVFISVDPPSGIPLGPTGLGVFGADGLMAVQMEPDKTADEKWYSVDTSKSWFHNPRGAATLEKWGGREGAMGLGMGLTIATAVDGGTSQTTDGALVISFPGPLIMLQGRSEFMEPGTTIDEEAPFQTIGVIDGRAGTVTLGIDARYEKPKDSEPTLLDIAGSAEAFFSFNDPDAWYVNLGRKPKDQRVRAEAVKILTADAYFMINASRVAMGAWAGYDKSYSLGPVEATLASYIDTSANLNLDPAHFHGDLKLHGEVSAEAFKVRVGRVLDIDLAADVSDPFHITGHFKFNISTPWPAPDPTVRLPLEWGPKYREPTLSDPIGKVGIGHKKLASAWNVTEESTPENETESRPVVPLDARPEVTFEHPVHNESDVATNEAPPDPAYETIGDPAKNEGPAEAKYTLESVTLCKWDPTADSDANDGPCSGLNGDGEEGDWVAVDDLDGQWVPLPQQPKQGTSGTGGAGTSPMTQTKLQLKTRTPFAYSRHTGGSWEDAIERWYANYPCPPEHRCTDFAGLDFDADFETTETEHDELNVISETSSPRSAASRGRPTITTVGLPLAARPALSIDAVGSDDLPTGVIEHDNAQMDMDLEREGLVLRGGTQPEFTTTGASVPYVVHISPPTPHRSVDIRLQTHNHEIRGRVSAGPSEETAIDEITATLDGDADLSEPVYMEAESEQTFTLTEPGDDEIDSVVLTYEYLPTEDAGHEAELAVMEVCSAEVDLAIASKPAMERRTENVRDQLAAWEDTGPILEPNTRYLLKVETRIDGHGRGDFEWSETKHTQRHIEFETGGPPGISTPTKLPSSESTADQSGTTDTEDRKRTVLDDLSRYVDQTEPATVPAEGERPPLPQPVYRTASVGVDFNEDYVDLLYRLANRDLALYLFDANDTPVRDTEGRLFVEEDQWGPTEKLLLDRAERRWFSVVDSSPCVSLDGRALSMTKRLEAGSDRQRVLDPDIVYEARLTPLLLRERFNGREHTLKNRWSVIDPDGADDSSSWTIVGHERFAGNDARLRDEGSETTIEFTDSNFVSDLQANRDSITFRYGDEDGSTDGGDKTYAITGVDTRDRTQNPQITLDSTLQSLPAPAGGGPQYEIPARHAVQQSDDDGPKTWDQSGTGLKLARVGATTQAPEAWDAIRIATTLRRSQEATGVIGLVFRYRNDDDYYRFTINQDEGQSRLIRVTDGTTERSWVVEESPRLETDCRIAIEAIGDDIRILVDDGYSGSSQTEFETVFAVQDPGGPDAGTFAFYSPGSGEARFKNVRVDDYRAAAPVAYSFEFITSLFTDLRHQLHSYQDETWSGVYPADVLPPSGDAEHRQYRQAAAAIEDAPPGKRSRALSFPDRLEVTRLDDESDSSGEEQTTRGFLVRSPEPIDWSMVTLDVFRGPRFETPPRPPDRVKITDATLNPGHSDTAVSMLLRETGDISGYSVEYRLATSPGFGPVLFDERFADDFETMSTIDKYEVRRGSQQAWSVSDSDDGLRATEVETETMLVRESVNPTTGILSSQVMPGDTGVTGLVFRHRAADSHYRFLLDSEGGHRLVRVSEGTETVLWEDSTDIESGHRYDVRLHIAEETIRGYIDDVKLFDVSDPGPSTGGSVGVLTTGDAGFGSLSWHNQGITPKRLDQPISDPSPADWEIVDEPPRSKRASDWAFDTEGDEIRQTSNLYGFEGPPINAPGTIAVIGESEWSDYRTTVTLSSEDDDAIGIVFRYQDEDNFYRFSMDAQRDYRRLVQKVDGKTRLLWEDDTGYDVGRKYILSIDCVGSRLTGYLDGQELFTVESDKLSHGAVGLYCRANKGARFHELTVTAPRNLWIEYHTFDDQPKVPAGTRIRLSAHTQDSENEDPRVKQYQPNGAALGGFPTDRVHLRVRTPDGEPKHAREFFGESMYDQLKSENISRIQSRDGAGLLLFTDAGLQPGHYRLTVSPDAKKSDLKKPVTLEIPWE